MEVTQSQQAFIMKDNFIRILSTRPLEKALIYKALERNITIDNISFIKTEEITDENTADQIKNLATKKGRSKRKVIVMPRLPAY